jgi:hypothetical protein
MGNLSYKNMFIVLLFFCLLSCNRTEKPYSRETALFNKYLKSMRIPLNRDMNYIVVITTPNSCIGCKKVTYNFFDTTKSQNIFLLSSDPSTVIQFPEYKTRMYYDSTGTLDRLDLPLPNVCAINYIKGNIRGIKLLNPQYPDSIIRCIENWAYNRR